MVSYKLTESEFADAIQKGLGRAVLAIDGPVSDEFKKVIFNACLVDLRHDHWFEEGRSSYMMQIVDRASLADELLPLLLQPLNDEDGKREKRLRKFMLAEFARRGVQRAWDILIENALNKDEEAYSAIAEIGAEGVEWLAANIIGQLPIEDQWRAEYWLKECVGQLTSSATEILTTIVTNSEEYQKNRPKYVPPKSPETLDEAIEELDTNRPLVGTIARIGKSFTDEEIQRVANLWLVEKDFRKARTYANLFDVRDFPYPFKVIIDRVLAGDPPFDFEDVLSYSDEPMVRELGLTLISQESPDSRGYTCLKNAFLDEDIPFLVKSLDRFVNVDHDEMHDICTALRDICETIPTAELRAPFLIWIYEHDPCSFCRNTATDILVEDGTLPENYRQEMAFDSDSDTRALVIPKPA